MELKMTLHDAIATARQKALAHLVQELLAALETNGYSLGDFIEALANHLHQTNNQGQAVYLLEQAAYEIASTSARPDDS